MNGRGQGAMAKRGGVKVLNTTKGAFGRGWLLLLGLSLLSSCTLDTSALDARRCVDDASCPTGGLCREGFCQFAEGDTPDNNGDAGLDDRGDVAVDDPDRDADVADAPGDGGPDDADRPDADTPDVDTPDADTPDVDMPDVDTPDADARNACGGTAVLDGAPGDPCGSCSGVLVCDGSDALRCDDPESVFAPGTVVVVDTFNDEFDSGMSCSLREAVRAVETGASFGGCEAGPSASVVLLRDSGTFVLDETGGRGGEDNDSGDIDITGSASVSILACREATAIDAGQRFRHFEVGRDASLSLTRVILQNGVAQGSSPDRDRSGQERGFGGSILSRGALTLQSVEFVGNRAEGGDGANGRVGGMDGGGGGGGGGGGMGGAIYNDLGTLVMTDVIFRDNQAQGGDGGDGVPADGKRDGKGGAGGGDGGDGGDGGGSSSERDGDDGAFGGGGGGGGGGQQTNSGGDGGFGGGGGGGGGLTNGNDGGDPGDGGFGAGDGSQGCCSGGGGGGGGAGFGGAVFNNDGDMTLTRVHFTNNHAIGGDAGDAADDNSQDANDGVGRGGAIFEREADSGLDDVTFNDNNADQGDDVARFENDN